MDDGGVPASTSVTQRMHHWRQSFSPHGESAHDLGISCLRQVLLCVLAGIRKMEKKMTSAYSFNCNLNLTMFVLPDFLIFIFFFPVQFITVCSVPFLDTNIDLFLFLSLTFFLLLQILSNNAV